MGDDDRRHVHRRPDPVVGQPGQAGDDRAHHTPLDKTGASNDNLYYTGTAGHIYNPGSGLGTPDLAKLAADLRAHP